MKHTRRDFIKTSAAFSAAVGASTFFSMPQGTAVFPKPARLETLSDWIHADQNDRKRGVEQCLERIREVEPSIHAWVQVHPEQPTVDGPLTGIPFGAKDIVETRGLATEYGSPL